MSHTLGIDPGVHHLGLCLVRDEDSRIVYWGVVTIDDSSVHTFLASFRECLGTIITDDKTISSVRIERQPSKNIRLSKIMHYIQIVCAITYPDSSIETVPPSRRIKFLRTERPDLACDTYYQRKKASIQYIREWLKITQSEWTGWFEDQPKQDDAAESLLLCFDCLQSRQAS